MLIFDLRGASHANKMHALASLVRLMIPNILLLKELKVIIFFCLD